LTMLEASSPGLWGTWSPNNVKDGTRGERVGEKAH
jgi:hypothetical protein